MAKGPKPNPPFDPDAKFGRIDQGVDVNQSGPYRAVGSGKVYKISKGHVVGGTNIGLYYHLDHPIVVNGRTYRDIYIWHTTPLVKVGARVKAGQPLMSGGAAEMGFASGGGPVSPLIGGLGPKTKPGQAGRDFYSFWKNGANSTAGRDKMPDLPSPDPTADQPPPANPDDQLTYAQQHPAYQALSAPDTSSAIQPWLDSPSPTGEDQHNQWASVIGQSNLSPETMSLYNRMMR